jgi:predicted metal-dependent hydrolase
MNMNTSTHPIEHEEVMAQLDGELPQDRGAVVAAHLVSCDECRQLAADLTDVSRRLQGWQVELPESGLALPVATELGRETVPTKRHWFDSDLISWGVGAAVCMVVVVGALRLVGTNASTIFVQDAGFSDRAAETQTKQFHRLDQSAKLKKPPAVQFRSDDGKSLPASGTDINRHVQSSEATASAPMIVRTAALSLTVQDFEKAHTYLDEILARHRGYLGGLQISSPSDQGRVLNGVLRIPVGQMDSALIALKNLGRVDAESQNGEEVTAQYVDLQARLANARNTEQRLTEVLQQRTGKLSDVLAVEKETARVRGEIESMEAERKSIATQVAFATLNLTLTEDYKPRLQTVPPSTLRQFRNSAVEGYQAMAAGLIGLVNAALFYGPSLLLWLAVAFFPVRSAWRRLAAKASETGRATAN